MRRMGYLTPEEIPVGTICRALYIPDDQYIIQAVYGALLELTFHWNWDEFGAVTPEEISQALLPYVIEFMGSACVPSTQVDIYTHEEAQNVAGGGLTANNNTLVPMLTPQAGNAGNVSITSNRFVLVPGRYLIDVWHVARAAAASIHLSYLWDATANILLQEGLHFNAPTNVQVIHRVTAHKLLTVTSTIEFFVRSNTTLATTALGVAANVSGKSEVYGQAVFIRIGDS